MARALSRVLARLHRWLGIGLGALLVAWFFSGFVLMWRGMPALPTDARLAALPPLDLASASLSPVEALAKAGLEPADVTVGMLGSRPVYRARTQRGLLSVFADDGSVFQGTSRDRALEIATRHLGTTPTGWRHARLTEPDQWTLQARAFLPMHRFRFDDPARRTVYVSERTGQVELVTDRASRAWGWLGPVVHWVYFTPIRRHSAVWLQGMIYVSLAALVLAATGLAWGIWVWLRRRRSPYSGWMRWHHLAGLVFGVVSLTWVLSGLLSLDPWSWHPGTSPTPDQRRAVEGPPGGSEGDRREPTVEELRTALTALSAEEQPRELELGWFRGRPYALARSPSAPARRRIAWLDDPTSAPAPPRSARALEEAAVAALPGAGRLDAVMLELGDSYYYRRSSGSSERRPLPVLRVRFDDPGRTALYFDPLTGALLHRERGRTRINRWLYHGLHSWDHPALLARPALRVSLMLLFLAGGLLASASAFVPGCRRLAATLTRRAARAERRSR